MTKRIKVKDISQDPPEQLLHLTVEELMPLPCCQGELNDNPPIRPLTEEQKRTFDRKLSDFHRIFYGESYRERRGRGV